MCEIVAGVGLDDNVNEDEEASQEELVPDGEEMAQPEEYDESMLQQTAIRTREEFE